MDSTISAPHPYATRTVTGIALHVDKYGDNEPQILTFFKSRTKVIDIGRKSTQSKGKIVREGASALFRCPVISRKHAKITFADYGSVQIVDLSSHHGTHILHAGELISKMITPEVPNVLSDGDVVTFGKSVGRDDTLVRPVAARVHLLFGTAPSPSPSPVPATPTNMLRSTTVSSGRYGIYPNSSSSSSSRSSSPALSDGGDSDVEEIPRPPTLFPVRSFGSSASLSLRTGRFGLLRRLLPPIHTSEVSSPQAELPHSPISVSSSSPSPDIVEINPEPSVVGAWPGSVASSRRPSPSPDPVLVAALEAMDKAKDASPAPEVQDPMELPHFISRSPARELCSCAPLDNDEEPAEVEIPEVHQEELEVFTDARSDCAEAGSHHNFLGLPSGIFEEYKPLTHPHWDECDASSLYSPSSPVSPPSYMDDDGRSPPADLFNARMESLKSRLADLEKQLLEQKHENAGNDFTAESSVQVNSQDSGAPAPAEASTRLLEDASAAVDSIKALVTEMEALRTKAAKDAEKELDAIRVVRAEAANAAAEAKANLRTLLASLQEQALAVAAPQPLSSPSPQAEVENENDIEIETPTSAFATLKRKRDETDDDDCDADRESSPLAPAPSMTTTSDAIAEGESCCGPPSPVARPMKRRRVLRIVEGVAKTTAIAAVGAVAAWSALAFS